MKYYVVSSQQLMDLLESGRIPPTPENDLFCRASDNECSACLEEAAEVAARYGFKETEG